MPHWTYVSNSSDKSLEQGDIIGRNSDVLDLLNRVHHHFCDEKYLAFLVVTQTCDLVRHDGKSCKTKYVNLAAIRALKSILPEILTETCGTNIERLLLRDNRPKAVEAIHRILNQNEQAMGLFYLHPDLDAGIAEPAVAMLRITIAVRSQHYEMLCNARQGRLAPQFSSKLGWLSGNLFSRVATPDWSDATGGAAELQTIVDGMLDDPQFKWVTNRAFKEANRKHLTADRDAEGVVGEIDKLRIESHRDRALAIVDQQFKEVAQARGSQLARQMEKIIGGFAANPEESQPESRAQMKQAIDQWIEQAVTAMVGRLRNDPEFKAQCRES